MRSLLLLLVLLLPPLLSAAEPDFPLTEDSKSKPDVRKGELIKGSHTAKESSVFPGTGRDYTLYLPPGFDKAKSAPFMVFQDGVIYQAPTVFDNLIAKKEIPPLIGIFVKPGVVPAANENALPRFNRSYEYDSVTDTYARFLIEELLPAIEQKHGLKLSTDPNDAAISGNSSGGIAAFMVAWHRPDRFRRVFTGVGTYVGIHGGDQLPVLVRKFEPKPIKIFLQSGTGDNNLYCGDWWMANQMMERSFTWAGYDVNHAWGEGGHNTKQASQIFPDVLRWLWKGWPEAKEVKANPRGESKWKGYEVVEGSGWNQVAAQLELVVHVTSAKGGEIYFPERDSIKRLDSKAKPLVIVADIVGPDAMSVESNGSVLALASGRSGNNTVFRLEANKPPFALGEFRDSFRGLAVTFGGSFYISGIQTIYCFAKEGHQSGYCPSEGTLYTESLCLSPDQTLLYVGNRGGSIACYHIRSDGSLNCGQAFVQLEGNVDASGLCVDTEGRLYVATPLGIQVCDQAGRVNFIILTPQQPYDVCFGGKDLSELYIACGDKIYKRQTKVHGIVSGQMAPIKPAAPKL